MSDKISRAYKRLSVTIFGGLVDRWIENFKPLKHHIMAANIRILLKTWVCMIFLTSTLAFLGAFIAAIILHSLFEFDWLMSVYIWIFVPVLSGLFTFLIFYIYPIQKSNSIKNSIEKDIPFALANISAIASSGIPPEAMFELITEFEEYGTIAEQAKIIVRNIKTFGMSSTKAITDVANRTPSEEFKQILTGITTTIEKGGNLVDYLNEMSDRALFDYRIKREKYLKTLSTYADIYTALLVAAPLMMLSVLGIMAIIGGTVLGLGIQELIFLITWIVLPALNVGFILFVHMTYPGL